MVASVGSTTDSTANGLGSALTSATGGKALGQDQFLKLLIAQISNQDPLKPMNDTEFVAQLAQFSALEQAVQTNSRLDLLALQSRGVGNTETAALVGKSVTVKGNKVALDGGGLSVPVNFTLADDSATVTVNVKDGSGKTIRTIQLGQQKQGLVKLSWDGRDDNGVQQPIGSYTIEVQAKTDGGGPVEVLQESTGVLKSVSFEKGYPLLELDNGVTAPASDLLKVNAK